MRDLQGWLKEFTDNLENTEVPASRDTGNTSHDSDSERPAKVATRRHSTCSHFQKDRNCEICKRTKSTKAPCRKRTGDAVLRAETSGDLATADHKVFNEGGESLNNHRYVVVAQDLATQWIQSYPRKTKTSQATEKSLQKFLEPSEKPKVIDTYNSLEFGEACEDLLWNRCTSTPH